MLRIREIREYKGKPRSISSSTTYVGKKDDDAAYSLDYVTVPSQYARYTHDGSTSRQHHRSPGKQPYPTRRKYSDEERFESEKPSVDTEDQLLKRGVDMQTVSKWKWETQDRARREIQDKWDRDHQEGEKYRDARERQQTAEERQWDRDAVQVYRDRHSEPGKSRRAVHRSVTVNERDGRGRSSHHGYSETAHHHHHYGTQLSRKPTGYYFEEEDDYDHDAHRRGH
ncbi:hypothetical protein RRF57_004247 [Xylaria bambusicola]|uniref:Uncharacterized protein n=1 Tax=Xylaria bambusicola TaxID=326684 RepID=A0AAN7Z3N5_9PEZI